MPKPLRLGQITDGKGDIASLTDLVNVLQDDASNEYRKRFMVTTSGTGIATSIWKLDMPKNSAWRVTAEVVGKSTIARASYIFCGLFFRAAAASAQQGATVSLLSIESAAACDATMAAVGNGVTVSVQDDGVASMAWTALIRVAEI